jgi:hypothetical protein
MPEYSYDSDDYRFQDDRPYYDFDEREWMSNSEARDRTTKYSDRPSSKPWWIELGVDMPDASPSPAQAAAAYQDSNDDDMDRIIDDTWAPISSIDFFLYPYLYRNSEWLQWNS